MGLIKDYLILSIYFIKSPFAAHHFCILIINSESLFPSLLAVFTFKKINKMITSTPSSCFYSDVSVINTSMCYQSIILFVGIYLS